MDDGYEMKFRCVCGEHAFRVQYRSRDEDIVAWVSEVVRPGLAREHSLISPLCTARSAVLLMPVSESDTGIGMRTEH